VVLGATSIVSSGTILATAGLPRNRLTSAEDRCAATALTLTNCVMSVPPLAFMSDTIDC
jgi:hypothetical protein